MSINLLEQLRKNLGVPELKKVDPNTQEVKVKTDEERQSRLMQAILPAAVAGVYDCARSEPGLDFLAGNSSSPDYINLFFGPNAADMQKNLEAYTGNSSDSVRTHFNSVAEEAVKILRESATGSDRKVAIRNTMGLQRKLFLPYLPAELQVGILLNDEAMDDRMNKMEGPVSGFMHRVENIFGRESREDANKKRDAKM